MGWRVEAYRSPGDTKPVFMGLVVSEAEGSAQRDRPEFEGLHVRTVQVYACDSCDRVVEVDDLHHVSACSLHDEATVCDDCLNGGRPRLAVVPA